MILQCPACSARFMVEPRKIGPRGRQVRCGKCRHVWLQTATPDATVTPEAKVKPEAAAPAAERASAQEPSAQEPSAEPDRPASLPSLQEFDEARRRSRVTPAAPVARRRPSIALVGWALFVLVLVGLAAGAWLGREGIVAAVPEAARIYELVGFHRERAGEGLELRDVTPVRRVVDGERILVIEGAIVNLSDQPRPVPRLRASLTDPQGVLISDWTFAAEAAVLEPGQSTRFQTSTQDSARDGNLHLAFEDG